MLTLALLISATLTPEQLAEKPSFSVPAADLLASAKLDPAGTSAVDMVMSLADRTYDDAGRRTVRYASVYVVRDMQKLGGWQALEAGYRPWAEKKPRIEARIVGPDGSEQRLDPTTLSEQPMRKEGEIYSDARVLGGPLPALKVGAVVETLIVLEETAPLFDAGMVSSDYLLPSVPTRFERYVVRAPKSVPLKIQASNLTGMQTQKRTEGDKLVTVMQRTNVPALDRSKLEINVPKRSFVAGRLVYATGASWAAVGKRYGAMVAERIAAGSVSPKLQAMVDASKRAKPLDTVAALIRAMQREVRYTGLELGTASIIPMTPDETLARHYGDCKDQATLLVHLLSRMQIPAQVALLNVNGADGDPELPGLGQFDHAIVYVPSLDLWVDTTTDIVRLGALPSADQNRMALVCNKDGSAKLLQTPVASDSKIVTSEAIVLPEHGGAHVKQTIEGFGVHEESMRSAYAAGDEKMRAHFDEVAKRIGARVIALKHPSPTDTTVPFSREVEYEGVNYAMTFDSDGFANVYPTSVLDQIDPGLKGETPLDKRKYDYMITGGYNVEERAVVTIPLGFRLESLPKSSEQKLGAYTQKTEFSQKDDEIFFSSKLTTAKRQLTPAEAEATRQALVAFAKTQGVHLRFLQIGEDFMAKAKLLDAWKAFSALAQAHPNEGRHIAQKASVLLNAGHGEEARKLAQEAAKLNPSDPFVMRTLGWVLCHDPLGREFAVGYDRDGAIAALKRAKTLDFTDMFARRNLAALYMRNDFGTLFGLGATVVDAIAELNEVKADFDEKTYATVRTDHEWALLHGRKLAELEAELADDTRNEAQPIRFVLLAISKGADAAWDEMRRARMDAATTQQAFAAFLTLGEYTAFAETLKPILAITPPESAAQIRQSIATFSALGGPRAKATAANTHEAVRQVQRFMRASLGGGKAKAADLNDTLISTDETPATDAQMVQVRQIAQRTFEQKGLTLKVVSDMFERLATWEVRGDDKLTFVEMIYASVNERMTAAMVKKNGKLKILALPTTPPHALGEEVLLRVKQGDLDTARSLLSWWKELKKDSKPESPIAWLDVKSASTAELTLGGALLAARPESAASIDRLGKLAAGNANAERVLIAIYAGTKRFDEMLPLCEKALAKTPAQNEIVWSYLYALKHSGRYNDALALFAKYPDILGQAEATSKADVLAAQGKMGEAIKVLEALDQANTADANMYNNLAWYRIVLGKADETTLHFAEKAARSTSASAAGLHTLATVQAELGNLWEARVALLDSLTKKGADRLEPHDYYVLGRSAEQLGMKDAAIRYYEKNDLRDKSPDSTGVMAEKRAAALKAR